MIIDIMSTEQPKTRKIEWYYMLRDKNGVHTEWVKEADISKLIK